MKINEFNPATQPDDENPEWTHEEIRDARPALELISEVFGVKLLDLYDTI